MKSILGRLVLLLPLAVFATIEDDFIQMVLRDCYSEESTVSLQSNAIDKLTCLDYHMTSTFNGHGIPRMLSLFQIHTGLTLLSIEQKLSQNTRQQVEMELRQLLSMQPMKKAVKLQNDFLFKIFDISFFCYLQNV